MLMSLLKFVSKVGVASALALVVGISAPKMHENWLRDSTNDSVVQILSEHGGGGTGFVVKAPSGQKYTITNQHVCEAVGSTPWAKKPNGTLVKIQVIEIYDQNDLCLLSAVPGLPALSISNDLNAPNDDVYIVGNPLLVGSVITKGKIVGKQLILIPYLATDNKCLDNVDPIPFFHYLVCTHKRASYMVTAKAAPGNSGSPTVNNFGRVVGVLFAGNQYGYSYIVPVKYINNLLKGY
jgi:S1-C subfamily serine protease